MPYINLYIYIGAYIHPYIDEYTEAHIDPYIDDNINKYIYPREVPRRFNMKCKNRHNCSFLILQGKINGKINAKKITR